MNTYFVGDIHGCYTQLQLLLKKVSFNSEKDELWVTGDLVSRGDKSFEVVEYLFSLGNRAKIVLGNHDIYLIKSYLNGFDELKTESYLLPFFENKKGAILIEWLRNQPLLRFDKERKFFLSHAGIPPCWDIDTALKYAKKSEKILKSTQCRKYLNNILSNHNTWNSKLNNIEEFSFIINALTRMRYINLDKTNSLNLIEKIPPHKNLNKNLTPWFFMKRKIPNNYSIFFGHWSALEGKGTPEGFFPLDTGCCWGKKLTIVRWIDKKKFFQSYKII
ncbi:symmetrical bis(5'-nucleosyl)-tetraphosphatase [Buchnera aphidicola (Kurisakia onigurumii)]|uniref:symmetrical bis(5'-nucleosyl)-tetraphosphatase n=1 Tax=Buchnera aphidicola TaxID=9 RepID=UPI0031B6ECFB